MIDFDNSGPKDSPKKGASVTPDQQLDSGLNVSAGVDPDRTDVLLAGATGPVWDLPAITTFATSPMDAAAPDGAPLDEFGHQPIIVQANNEQWVLSRGDLDHIHDNVETVSAGETVPNIVIDVTQHGIFQSLPEEEEPAYDAKVENSQMNTVTLAIKEGSTVPHKRTKEMDKEILVTAA